MSEDAFPPADTPPGIRTAARPKDHALFLKTLLDTIPNPVFYKDTAGIYRGCNKAFAEQILGLPEENIVGCSLFDLEEVIPRELARTYYRQDQALVKNPGTQFYESKVRCADGVKRHFLFNKATFCDADGEVAGIVGVMLDITQRKLAEDALRHSEARYRRLFEDAVLGIFESTVEGRILNVNPAFAKMFGYASPQELLTSVGGTAEKLYGDGAARVRIIRQVVQSDTPVKSETVFRRRDGSLFTGNFHVWQVKDTENRILYLEGFVEDVTDRKRVEESLRESARRLRFLSSKLLSVQESESRRISMEIHDAMGQNLAVLKLQLVAISKKLRKDQRPLKNECRKALDLINQIIESARNLSRDLSPSIIEDLKLGGTLKWMLQNFQAQTGIRTDLEMDDIDGLFSNEDQVIIYRIFQEALRNIIKHADARRVTVVVRRRDGEAVFQITDDGKGFELEAVWNRHVSERSLGLAALYERSRMLGGILEIDTRQGGGTQITLKISTAPSRGAS
jgi:PAS domain S-box-containing protein